MSPLILASQSQALPLLLLPLAMSAGNVGGDLRHHRPVVHRQAVVATPLLFPGDAITCSTALHDDTLDPRIGGRYAVHMDPRLKSAVIGAW